MTSPHLSGNADCPSEPRCGRCHCAPGRPQHGGTRSPPGRSKTCSVNKCFRSCGAIGPAKHGRLGQRRSSVGPLQHLPFETANHPSEEIDLKRRGAYLEIIGKALRAGAVLRDKF